MPQPGTSESIDELIVSYDHSPGPAEIARIEQLGGSVIRTLVRSSALAVELPSGSVGLLALEPGVVEMNPDVRLNPSMDIA